MNENSMSGWSALSGSSPYSADDASMMQNQSLSGMLAGASATSPSLNGMMSGGMNTYGGGVSPSSINGYPMFSSPQAGLSSPSGYVSANPIDATPSVIQAQARAMTPQMMPQNPSMPTQATQNPWNIKQSSQPGSFDYPLGQNSPPPKLNVL